MQLRNLVTLSKREWASESLELTVDGLSASSVVVGEIATLAHEVGDDTVESRALVPVSLLAGAEGTEVFSGLGDNVVSQLERFVSLVI